MHKKNGYVVDCVYPSYFYADTQPLWLSTVARLRGLQGPDIDTAYRYCELGCGTGFNVIVAAALNPLGQFVGIDFNPQHIAMARELARDMGVTNVAFRCCDFQQFFKDDMVPFDMMNCHGVWSWVSPGSQRMILEIVARHLKPKGLFCLHYMCHPGSTSMLPVHDFLRGVTQQGDVGSAASVARALDAVDDLLATGYGNDQPRLQKRLRGLRSAGVDNLAHDLLSDFWSVHNARDIHLVAAQASLSFIGSSEVFYNTDPTICIPPEMQALLAKNPSPAVIETLKDMASQRPHRSDVFQKNAARPSGREHLDALNSLAFMRIEKNAGVDMFNFVTPFGAVALSDGQFNSILDLATKKDTFTFGDLVSADDSPAAVNKAVQAVTLMLHAKLICPAQKDQSKGGAELIAQINRMLMARKVGLEIERDSASAHFRVSKDNAQHGR
jgi:SAM-dependent methyltransferase